MSRVGLKPILVDAQVTVTLEGDVIHVSGPKGNITITKPEEISVKLDNGVLEVKADESDKAKSIHGLIRSILSNAIKGVVTPWSKDLELVGVGFRAQTTGQELVLHLGFSHPVDIKAPDGITFAVSENVITVTGVDKYVVGEVAASIRRCKKPEPYKGKGIRYKGEYIRKKLGKAAKAVGAAGGAK